MIMFSKLFDLYLQKPEMTTPPSVYIEIQLRMDWNQFCVSKSLFILEIKGIVFKEKGVIVEEERFKMNIEVTFS